MRAKSLLRRWAIWRLEPRFSAPQATPLGRIMDDHLNAGAGANQFHYDVIEFDGEAVACMPDGGMYAAMLKHGGQIGHDQICGEVDALVSEMRWRYPTHYRAVAVTFGGPSPKDAVRRPCAAAKMLGLAAGQYGDRMRQIYDWFEARLQPGRMAA